MEIDEAVEKKNDFELLVENLRSKEVFSDLLIKVDEPSSQDGSRWLNVQIMTRQVVVTWLPGKGFGFFKADAGYGERPDRTTHDLDRAKLWLEQSIEVALLLTPPAL